MEEGKAGIHDMMKTLRKRLLKDVGAYYKGRGHDAPFGPEHVVVSPSGTMADGRRRGYFFNGDLRLELDELDGSRNSLDRPCLLNPECRESGVLLWPLGEGITLECLDGERISAARIHDRLASSFARIEQVEGIEDACRLARKGDVLLCAPVDIQGLEWWVSAVRSQNPDFVQLLERGVRIILVPDSDAAESRDPSDFAALDAADVHTVYTRDCEVIPEVKLVDAILCTGPRVKYRGFHIDSPKFEAVWKANARKKLKNLNDAYEILANEGALGDCESGSASLAWPGYGFAITASKTDKLACEERDVSLVLAYSPSYNELRWAGIRRPSSSSPWHAYVYSHVNWAKAILHTHNKVVTYGAGLEGMRTPEYVPYGTVTVGEAVVNRASSHTSEDPLVLILEGHGEVAVGRNLNACANALIEIHMLAQARNNCK